MLNQHAGAHHRWCTQNGSLLFIYLFIYYVVLCITVGPTK